MNFKNRFIRMSAAFAIVGIVATQIPSRPSVSLAADEYTNSPNGLLTIKGGGGLVIGAAAVAAIANFVRNSAGSGNVSLGGATVGGGGLKSISLRIQDEALLSEFYKILANAGVVQGLSSEVVVGSAMPTIQSEGTIGLPVALTSLCNTESNSAVGGPWTVFAPTNDALIKALGQERVTALQQPANAGAAKQLVESLIVEGSYSLNTLKATSSKVLPTNSGDTIEVNFSGGKLTANGVSVLDTEYPCTNGRVLIVDGLPIKS